MDSAQAFARGKAARNDPARVFDWDEAARRIVASGATTASAGLEGDWEWTGGKILRNGAPVPPTETYTYLASTWAIPELILGDGIPEPCWRWKDGCDWDAETYWPQSALDILNRAAS
jgi:hypothetical protein